MRLELGKRYRTRGGQETSPIQRSSNPSYPFKAEVADRIETWKENGIWNINYKEEYHLNLVEEIKEAPLNTNTMKIKLGKLEFEAKEFPIRLYNKDGKEIYYCNLDGDETWHEYDEDGDLIYCHHSKGNERGTPRSKSLEGKVVEIDGKMYKLKEVK